MLWKRGRGIRGGFYGVAGGLGGRVLAWWRAGGERGGRSWWRAWGGLGGGSGGGRARWRVGGGRG